MIEEELGLLKPLTPTTKKRKIKNNDTLEEELNNFDDGEINIKDKSELGECFDNLDCVNNKTPIQSLDLNSRLSSHQIKAIFIIDTLNKMGIYPEGLELTNVIKGLAVSLAGKGREEKVKIIVGERDNRQGGNFWDKVKGVFQ